MRMAHGDATHELPVGTSLESAFVGEGGNHELTGEKATGLYAFMYRFLREDETCAFRVDADIRRSSTRLSALTELLHSPGGHVGLLLA